MPLFGGDDKNEAKRAEVERLDGLPIAELAAEVMAKGFGPDAPGSASMSSNRAGATAEDVANLLTGGAEAALGDELRAQLYGLVAEAIQQLEHAGLVVLNLRARGQVAAFHFVATRAGREALASGDVARRVQAGADAR